MIHLNCRLIRTVCLLNNCAAGLRANLNLFATVLQLMLEETPTLDMEELPTAETPRVLNRR